MADDGNAKKKRNVQKINNAAYNDKAALRAIAINNEINSFLVWSIIETTNDRNFIEIGVGKNRERPNLVTRHTHTKYENGAF